MGDVTPEQYKLIQDTVEVAARIALTARQFTFVAPPVGFGVEVYGYDKLVEMAKGKIDLSWGNFSEEGVDLKRTNIPVGVLHREFRINRRSLAASQRSGTPLDTTTIDAATYAVGRQEEDTIVSGYSVDGTTYEIAGLYPGAGNTDACVDFTTAVNILTSYNTAIGLLAADNILGPYNTVLHPTQYNELFAIVSNTAVFYNDLILDRLGAGGGIFVSQSLTAGTGMTLGLPARKYFKAIPGVDLTVESSILEKSKDLWGIVYETMGVAIPESNGICSMTVI